MTKPRAGIPGVDMCQCYAPRRMVCVECSIRWESYEEAAKVADELFQQAISTDQAVAAQKIAEKIRSLKR